jgi:hypothetical protein
MKRRDFTTVAGAMLAAPLAAQNTTQPAILEIRRITMRTTQENQMQRTSDYLAKGAMPALQRAGAGPLGFFGSVIAEESPFIVTLTQFPSVAAWEAMRAKQSADPEYRSARDAYNSASGRSYERLEVSLLRCFSTAPAIEVPPAAAGSGRIFELRQYESPNGSTLERKIRMFNEGEIGIFRKNGMRPVFFGEMIAGTKMPNLVYMLAFDSMAARVSAWSAFGSDPAWKELRSKSGYSDAEIVSNISNSILSGLPFSPIR